MIKICELQKISHILRATKSGNSRNKTRPAKVVVVANSKQKCSVRTHKVVKYTPKKFGYDCTLYCDRVGKKSHLNGLFIH